MTNEHVRLLGFDEQVGQRLCRAWLDPALARAGCLKRTERRPISQSNTVITICGWAQAFTTQRLGALGVDDSHTRWAKAEHQHKLEENNSSRCGELEAHQQVELQREAIIRSAVR